MYADEWAYPVGCAKKRNESTLPKGNVLYVLSALLLERSLYQKPTILVTLIFLIKYVIFMKSNEISNSCKGLARETNLFASEEKSYAFVHVEILL